MEADFSGFATKAGVKCSDGRTIMPGAFKHQDKVKVPLVWQHGHSQSTNVLGHAILEYRENGDVYAYSYFNDTDEAKHARQLVEHGDINMLSIWANDLVERAGRVLHGAIREVSLVLSGANPGAVIENVTIRHSDGGEDVIDGEAIIFTGTRFDAGTLIHAEEETTNEDNTDGEDDGGETLQDVYDAMSEQQKDVVHYMIGQAMAAVSTSSDDDAKQDNVGDADDDTIQHDNSDKEGSDMTTRNVFENDGKGTGNEDAKAEISLSHSDVKSIVADAARCGSLKQAVEHYAEAHLEHGIENLELLFPEATAVTNTPEWDKRRTEWVGTVLSGTRKRPFSRIKSWTADITYDEARAKGYIKGDLKKEEFFSIAKRETTPQTIYKKQKLDRDDIIDITDFSVVTWMKSEMRMMLDEEIARAILIGDGRDIADADKILEDKIRPIALDDPYYTIEVPVDLATTVEEIIDQVTLFRQYYKGTGMPTFFTSETYIAQLLLLKDADGRRLYRSLDEVASDMRVDRIVAVEILDEYPSTIGVIVNLNDYSVGTDRGGQVTMFDDFDIDYNQEKYLIETRLSGALTSPKTAMHVVVATGDTEATATAPGWDPDTWTVTIPTVTGVEYLDQDGAVLSPGATVLTAGQTLRVNANATTGYYLAAGKNQWSFLRATGT